MSSAEGFRLVPHRGGGGGSALSCLGTRCAAEPEVPCSRLSQRTSRPQTLMLNDCFLTRLCV